MPSQFFGLNIAYTGLLASNAAMNTTSNNIANVQTEGYSRQQVTQQAANALRVFQTYGCAGAGVETLAIERVRDEFYDGRYWDNNALLGEYDMKQYYMQQLETYATVSRRGIYRIDKSDNRIVAGCIIPPYFHFTAFRQVDREQAVL